MSLYNYDVTEFGYFVYLEDTFHTETWTVDTVHLQRALQFTRLGHKSFLL